MKYLFAGLAAVFLLLYAIAQGTLEGETEALRWATDPNPARDKQTATFNAGYNAEVMVESGAMEKLLAQCATGVGPDLIDTYSLNQLANYVNAGILLDLTPYAEAMGFGPSNTYAKLQGALSIEGKQYRFPCNVWANCVIYNAELFDRHGVPHPEPGWTWADFVEIAKGFGPVGAGEALPLGHYNPVGLFYDFLISHGGRMYSADGLVSALDSPEAIAAMQQYHDFMHVHRIIPPPSLSASLSTQGGWGGGGGLAWFSEERAAMLIIGRWYLNILVKYPGVAPKLRTVLVPRTENGVSTGVTGARGAGINAKSPRREEALQFLQYLASEEYNRLIIEDGDALPPNPAYARTGADLVNAIQPDPDFHQPFIDAASNARTLDVSPFIDPFVVERWVTERISRVENNPGVNVPDLMGGLAREINRRIRRNLDRQNYLREKYEHVTGQAYEDDWVAGG